MTVFQLIERLSKFPADMPIIFAADHIKGEDAAMYVEDIEDVYSDDIEQMLVIEIDY